MGRKESKIHEKLYEEGRLEGYKIGTAERIARIQAWKIAAIAGSLAFGAICFSLCLVRFRSVMHAAVMDVKQLKRMISMKTQEIASTQSQKAVLQTSHSHQLLTFSQQSDSMQCDLQKLIAGNSLLLEGIQHAKHRAPVQQSLQGYTNKKIDRVARKSKELQKEVEMMQTDLQSIQAMACVYGCVFALVFAFFP